MTRRRLTWSANRKASPPPALPTEDGGHPAAYPDPGASQYENGDTSSWAEDPHPPPYQTADAPALPSETGDHPAADGASWDSKRASRDVRAAMERKAAKCIRIAQATLGHKASVEMIEDHSLDLMSLGDRQIQAMLDRIAECHASDDVVADDLMADDLMADDLMADDLDGLMADDLMIDEEDVVVPMGRAATDEEDAEDEDVSAKAAHYARLAAHYERLAKKNKAAGQNDPRHTYTAGSDEDVEAEELLAAMLEEEASKKAKKADEDSDADAEANEEEGETASKKAKKADDEDVEANEEEEETASKKANEDSDAEANEEEETASKKAKKADEDADAEANEEEETASDEDDSDEETASKKACGDDEMMIEDMDVDPLSLMDEDDSSLGDDEMAILYGGRFAKSKKADEDSDAEANEEEEETASKKASKKAGVQPQRRAASAGVRQLGTVNKTASGSSEVDELSKLWETAPDISKIFG